MRATLAPLLVLPLALSHGGSAGCSREPDLPSVHILLLTEDEAGLSAFRDVAAEIGVGVTATADAAPFTGRGLAAYGAVAFLNTSGDVLDAEQERALRRFVQAGGGFVGLHGAGATEPDWPWFTRLVGAGSPRATVIRSGAVGAPAAWRQEYDGGRSFCDDRGRDSAEWDDAAARAELSAGLAWVLEGATRRPERVLPDDETFHVETLVDGLEDPIEIAVDRSGHVFVLEREGALKRYDARDERLETVHRFEVASKTEEGGWAQECGGLGLALDPAFDVNRFLYVYWSPREPSVNRLSRFTFMGDRLVEEQVLLDVPTDRENTTCHEGGSLAFGPDGDLYLSTGDNTNPFASDGFAPLDEREDRRWWDAQRSSGSSNDLRGAILRIRPLEEGGYAIPPGNLWPEGTARTRPEILVKGCRNPYRIAIDPKTGAVWWGDVGPDADVDEGGDPEGTDELNRASEAGFYGWPYVRGGRAYRDRDFETGERGASFADGIVNDSPHADGLESLPPPIDPFFSYPYRPSAALPELGDGGRNAMAGPIMYHDGAEGGFPPWFDRVMVFYDWSRAGLWLLKLDAQERLETLLPWLEGETFKHPIDLERGADGALYLLEYGSTWWDNEDGRLRRIRFGGFDLRPRVRVTPSATSGAAPLEVTFAIDGTVDPEAAESTGDPMGGLRWRWTFGDGATSSVATPTHVFRRPGAYEVVAVATDAAGQEGRWSGRVVAGNAAPTVRLTTSVADGAFAWGEAVEVDVSVEDADEEVIDPARLSVTAEYLEDGIPDADVAEEPLLPGLNPRLLGTRLLAENGCTSCHHPRLESVGPSFERIVGRYRSSWDSAEAGTRAQLVVKVQNGWFGTWGNVPMPAHRHVPEPHIENMIDAIFAPPVPPPVAVVGGRFEVPPRPEDWREAFGVWRVRARYSDVPPADLLPSLTMTAEVVLEAPPVVTRLADEPGTPTVLPGPSASIEGEDAVRGEEAIEWWSDEGTALVFSVRVDPPGTWRVAVEWGSPDHEAGSKWALDVAGVTFEGTVPATGGREVGEVVEAGSIDLDAGTHEITLRAPWIASRFAGDVRGLVLIKE